MLRRFARVFSPTVRGIASTRPLRMEVKEAAAMVARAPAFDTFDTTSITLSVVDKPGALFKALEVFAKENINIRKIESRSCQARVWDYDFRLTFDGNAENPHIQQVLRTLRSVVHHVTVDGTVSTPWFPLKIQDLDRFAERNLEYGEDLGSDHPGFSDKDYRARRKQIVEIAKTYRYGKPIPRVDYLPSELATWKVIYNRLMELAPKYACREYQYCLPILRDRCGYSEDTIPQLEDISSYLQTTTGFRLRPVSGLLTSRDFLNGLAHRTFHSTQYIRHHSHPLYTPEPDVVHELLGHVPLFADPDFADFSQEIGLASLGASEEDVAKLATLYWFTVEFGVVRQMGQVKAFGAGILSSFGEIEHCFSGKPDLRPFDINKMATHPFPITEYQPVYWVAESFKSMTDQLREFSRSLNRPFIVKYNPYALQVETFEN